MSLTRTTVLTITFLTGMFLPTAYSQELHYTGQLSQLDRSGVASPVKEFTVSCLLKPGEERSAYYHIEENRPALPWPSRIGSVNSETPFAITTSPVIGYKHEGRMYALPLLIPFVPGSQNAANGTEWEHEKTEFKVIEEPTVEGQLCWVIQADSGPARTHRMTVRQSDHVVIAGRQTMFMGQGDKFRIDFKLSEEAAFNSEQLANSASAWEALFQFNESLNRSQNSRTAGLTNEQAVLASKGLPKLVESVEGSSVENLASEILKDIETHLGRMEKVDQLAETLVGKSVPSFTLTQLDGTKVDAKSFAGQTTVLHFWAYMDEPLEQPYGQTAYLEFMNNRWRDLNVQVIGIAVDAKLTNPETQRAAIQSIKRLKKFMRLDYDVMYDEGGVLNSFGNPTRLGEEMPLWIVISPEGKVVYYKTGLLKVDNQTGLKQLDIIVQKQSEKQADS